MRVVQQRVADGPKAQVKVFQRCRGVAIAPGAFRSGPVFFQYPLKAAELGHPVGLAAVGNRDARAFVGKYFAACHVRVPLLEVREALGPVFLVNVIVRVVNVRADDPVGVAGRIQNRPGQVHGLCRQVHSLGDIVQHGCFVADELAGLVQRAPADNARVRIIPLQRFQPLRNVAGIGLVVIIARPVGSAAPVAELAPDEIAQPVGVVQKPLFKDFLVQTRPVEADI